MTVIVISSFISSLKAVPKIHSTSSAAESVIILVAVSTSDAITSSDITMFINNLLAPAIEVSSNGLDITALAASVALSLPEPCPIASLAPATETSNKGEEIARFAASFALSSPDDIPIPINAFPLFFITAQISAKSRLINPSSTIKSDILLTPTLRISSAKAKDSFIVRGFSRPTNNFSLGITIRESTYFLSSLIPASA